ncbi:MAG: enoyl-CoA hydratase/isomerase family protein [Acidimicrobiia bacterium]
MTATIDRPERRNALSLATVQELLAWLTTPGEARPLVIGSTGTTFSAGFDLQTPQDGAAFKACMDELLPALIAHSALTVAALNGPAIGMGLMLAAGCDVRVAAATAWIEMPAAKLGYTIDARYVAAVRDRMGEATARMLFVASRRISAEQALAWGALHAIADDPVSVAEEWARHTTRLDADAITGHKRALHRWG